MSRKKQSSPTKSSNQEILRPSDPTGMDEGDEDESRDYLYNSEDEGEDSSQQVPAQGSSPSHNGPTTSTKHKYQSSDSWGDGGHNRFGSVYRSPRHDNMGSGFLLDDELNTKTDRLTKEGVDDDKRSSQGNERSLPVSLKLQKKPINDAEMNNNLDDIQPQFKELSLHSPRGRRQSRDSIFKSIRFYVEAACTGSTSQGEIMNISYEPMYDGLSLTERGPELDSSGHLADQSKTLSSLSGSPMTYIPPPPTHLTRMSCASSSSGSSLAGSSTMLTKMPTKTEGISQTRINYLTKKWRNSNLVYGLLDYIDKIMCEEINAEMQNLVNKLNFAERKNLDCVPEEAVPLGSRKRHPSPEQLIGTPTTKRMRPTSPVTSKISPRKLLGAEIFAKWQNRRYYFAHVIRILDDNHLQVDFLDNTRRTVNLDQIVSDLGSLRGHKVMVADKAQNEKYYPGIVTSLLVDNGVLKYSVLTDSGDFEAGVEQIYFTEHQAKLIKKGMHMATQSDESGASSLHPGCSGMQKYSDTHSDTGEASLDADKHVIGCDVETNDPQNLNPSVKLKNVQGKIPKRSNKNEDSLLGPLKVKGAWFKGFSFMITCSTRPASSATEDVQTDSEDYPFTNVPFVYDRLVQQIKLGGGEVFDKFTDIHPSKYKNTYLVTNRPCLTPKYLKCLAAGITIVCHEWIVNSTIKQKRQPLLDLPAGWSVEKNKFVNMFDRKTSQPFSGLRIKLAQFVDQHFYKFWSGICNVVGATASIFTGTFENTNVIVAENGLKDPTLDKAIAFGVNVVSASWIIQSIIHGEARPYDGHPSYNHLYEETEEF